MPIPFIVGAAAAAAAAYGGKKAYDGYNTKEEAEKIRNKSQQRYETAKQLYDERNEEAKIALDALGKFELKISSEMSEFNIIADELLNRISTANNSKRKINLLENNSIFITATISSGISTNSVVDIAKNVGKALSLSLLAISGYWYNKHAEQELKNAEEYRREVNVAITKFGNINYHLLQVITTAKKLNNELERIYTVFSEYSEQFKSINTLIKSNALTLESMSDKLMILIENGYQIAAILTDIITTPLFKLKKDSDGNVVMKNEKDYKGNTVSVPEIELDINEIQKLNTAEIKQVLEAGKDEKIQALLIK